MRPLAKLRRELASLVALLVICFFTQGATAAEGAWAPVGPQPCAQVAAIRKVDAETAALQVRGLIEFPLPWNAMLSDGVPQLSFAEMGMIFAGIVAFIGFYGKVSKMEDNIVRKAASAVRSEQAEKPQMHIAGQPLSVSQEHPCVKQPEFHTHKSEIWEEVNGLKKDIGDIKSKITEVATLRDENGRRLVEVAVKQDSMSENLNRIVGGLEANGLVPKRAK